MDYLIQQLTTSTINADVLRAFWKSQYKGKTSKQNRTLRRDEVIQQIAEQFVVQHGTYAQVYHRDRCGIYNCPYMDHTG
eukprot:3268274-Karenia_brevis.AAC.1